jgi:hypothetical protein
MQVSFGTLTTGSRTEVYAVNKYPNITQEVWGNESDVRAAGSTYSADGWNVTFENGQFPFKGTMNVTGEIGSDNKQVPYGSGSIVTVNWKLRYNTTEKEILDCNTDVISWINNITVADKALLKWQIANTSSLDTSKFTGGSTSIAAANVVWTMAQNGQKTVPIIQQVLTKTLTVPNTYVASVENTNVNPPKIYSNSTMVSETGMPSFLSSVRVLALLIPRQTANQYLAGMAIKSNHRRMMKTVQSEQLFKSGFMAFGFKTPSEHYFDLCLHRIFYQEKLMT